MENVIEKVRKIEQDFLNDLKNMGVELSDLATCRVSENSIIISLKENDKYLFASEVELDRGYSDTYIFGKRENSINFGSSGSFDPSYKASYWRTIHAAGLLKNWEKVTLLVNSTCESYSELFVKTH